jgi:hypothetical protein
MDIIRDNIFLIILLLVGAISQWLKARGEARENQDPGYDPAEIEEMIEEAERRHSRPAVPPPLPPNAFPQPPGSVVAPAPSLRRKSREPVSASAAFDTSSELARQQELAEKLKEMKRTRGARAMSESLQPRKQAAAMPGAGAGLSLKQRLGHRRELRQAFVLKEILEKPVGLR